MHKVLGFEDGQVAESSFVHPQENVLQSDNSFLLFCFFKEILHFILYF